MPLHAPRLRHQTRFTVVNKAVHDVATPDVICNAALLELGGRRSIEFRSGVSSATINRD